MHGRTAAHVAAAQRFPLLAQQLSGSGSDAFGHSVQSILRLHAETEVATVEDKGEEKGEDSPWKSTEEFAHGCSVLFLWGPSLDKAGEL